MADNTRVRRPVTELDEPDEDSLPDGSAPEEGDRELAEHDPSDDRPGLPVGPGDTSGPQDRDEPADDDVTELPDGPDGVISRLFRQRNEARDQRDYERARGDFVAGRLRSLEQRYLAQRVGDRFHNSGDFARNIDHSELCDPDSGELCDSHIDAAVKRVLKENPHYEKKPAPNKIPGVASMDTGNGGRVSAGQGIKAPRVIDRTNDLGTEGKWYQVFKDAANPPRQQGNLEL